MTTRKSRIGCSIDLTAPGKQLGYLTMAWSDNRWAGGPILIPIASIANGKGKTALITGGTHGDEYEGQMIGRRLIAELDPAHVTGRVIVLPAFNYLAVLEASRVSTVDNINMNRAFPGNADGTPTEMLAHWVETMVLPHCGVALDLHSGGKTGEYLPVGYFRQAGDRAFMEKKVAAFKAFGAPMTVVVGPTSDDRSLSAASDRHGVAMVSAELGGLGAVSPEAYRIGYAGVRGVLAHFGIVAPPSEGVPRPGTRFMLIPDRSYNAMARAPGLFFPAAKLGDAVREGQLAGTIYPVDDLTLPTIEVRFQRNATVVARRASTLVRRGEFVFNTAIEVDEAKLY
jgi:N-alpha-acetyl-L-2,4-diaminobutyrate deacetylase